MTNESDRQEAERETDAYIAEYRMVVTASERERLITDWLIENHQDQRDSHNDFRASFSY